MPPPVGASSVGIKLDQGESSRGKRKLADAEDGAGKKANRTATPSFEMPWVEKYRPKLMKDVIGNGEAVKRLKVIAEHGNIPNLLLAGSPGTGKTTSVLCIANQLLGPLVKEAVLELNASDERGIDVVRNRIKMFAQKKVTLPPGRHKIVILDEADSMTQAAQQALRRTMEIYSNTTRFALACNVSTKIIEPIQSRCAVVRFTRLSDEDVLLRLLEVCELEGVPKTNEGLEAIIFTADGDMRQALNNLQATYSGFGLVNADNVFKVCDQPHPTVVKEIINSCVDADIDKAVETMETLWDTGFSANDLVTTLFRVCRSHDMQEFLKLEFIREVGLVQMRILQGVNSQLQMAGLLAKLCKRAAIVKKR
ncbi:subunit 2 of DNA replication factor C complex [Chloropicon primus]|uniref:Replication factor C subunit 2 n=2 Tax=Chloropicon primus TaxID=1764295 RepID=A0A5B8MEH1_9CHLO|nr:subunit 2 of DNA replication factor C complex [Chloropicon primus]UPQ97269.1 subunit 2 of DNA replication factor C complex [Chloropicon primus]|eukprot:QDZ18055.1 subunit 2 of DNA replication factor C complex [Chloropicon primus]